MAKRVKNTLTDLNNLLFEEMERIMDEELTGEELDKELRRAEVACKISGQIIANGHLAVNAIRTREECLNADVSLPSFIEAK